MKIKKKIVWALFDDGYQSVKKSLNPNEYEVFSFGINIKNGVEQIDLSQNINNIINYFNNYPKADIIVASPPCTTFSKASGVEKGMNAYLHYSDLREREKETYTSSLYKFENSPITDMNKKQFAILSKKVVDNTISIIKKTKVKFWYIENPRLSLIWRYIDDTSNFHNIVNYGAYDHPVKKPTIFLSNVKMNLKIDTKGKKFLKWDKEFTDKEKRSSIPSELIKDIFKNFTENNNMQQLNNLSKGQHFIRYDSMKDLEKKREVKNYELR